MFFIMNKLYTAIKQSHPSARKILYLQIAAHIGLVYLVVTGSVFEWLACAFAYFLYGCIGFTVTYHRLLSHRAFKSSKLFRAFGVLCGVMGGIGSPLTFVGQHRDHHRYTDMPKDIYSRFNNPVWYAQWFTMLEVEKISLRRAADLFRDPICRFAHRNYFKIHIAYAVLLFCISPMAVVYFYLAPMAIVWNIANSINTVCHQPAGSRIGYKNFNPLESSVCVLPLGYLSFGEGWHNNHHMYGRSANFGIKWWELDIGYQVIRIVKIK